MHFYDRHYIWLLFISAGVHPDIVHYVWLGFLKFESGMDKVHPCVAEGVNSSLRDLNSPCSK